jgi:1-acyl-sn-glycerol-3-phosphate acyltransferase
MTATPSFQTYIAEQDKFAWRRRILRGVIRTIGFRLLARVDSTGLENIPPRGPAILMMNHISMLDPVACMGLVTSRFVIPMSKIENLRVPILSAFVRFWGAYTVDRDQVDRAALMNSIELLKSGQLILIAPEGTRHPEGLARPKEGMTYIAIKSDAVIIPTAVSGAIDFKQRWKRLRRAYACVSFGRPFRFKAEGRKRIPRDEMRQMTEEAMYQLALTQPDPDLRGVYSDLDQATTDTLEFIDPQNVS